MIHNLQTATRNPESDFSERERESIKLNNKYIFMYCIYQKIAV
jgi:hypothetical protein